MYLTDPDVTDQGLFDAVVHHLFAQKKRATQRGFCRYRTPDGLSCAVGCLIDPARYHPRMDEQGMTISEVLTELGGPRVDYALLARLRLVHDAPINWTDAGPRPGMLDDLAAIADDYGLSADVLKTYRTAL